MLGNARARNGRHLSRNPFRSCRFVGLIAGLTAASFCSALAAETDSGTPKLRPSTIQAFEHYVQLTDGQRLQTATPFLWVDALAERESSKAYSDLNNGRVQIKRLETRDQGQQISCPHGLIHHWVGLIFMRGVTMEETLRVLQDYNHHAEYYTPDVQRSKLLSRDGEDFRVYLRFHRKKVITVVLNTEHQVRYTRIDATHGLSRSSAIRIAEVENPDSASEHEKTPGNDGGYLWRMETWWRIAERNGGTYLQCESVSLTRDIPAGLGWLVGPFVNSIPRESLTFTLEATRRRLTKKVPDVR